MAHTERNLALLLISTVNISKRKSKRLVASWTAYYQNFRDLKTVQIH